MKLMKFVGALVLGCIFCSVASAALELELTQGVDDALPIALLTKGGAPFTAALFAVVKNDLTNSGRFKIADALSQAGIVNNQNFDYAFWRGQKVNAVLNGEVNAVSASNQVNCQLYDSYNEQRLFDEHFNATANQARSLAHHISDLVYEKMLGIPGVFSTKIAYVLVQRATPKTTRYSLVVADADGYNARALLTSSQPIMSPAWSPDGKKIAYVSFENSRAAIFVQQLATGAREKISSFPGINGAPAWSPDGRKMALVLTKTRAPKIYLLDLASRNLTPLTFGSSLDTEPSFAPDAKSLIFTSNRGGGPQIYRLDLGSGDVERVTYQGSYNARASFTPDGKTIVMLHQEDDGFYIAAQDLAAGRLTILSKSGGFDESPSVAPNGVMIVYATNYNGRGVLAEVSLDAKVMLRLPAPEGEVQEPAWGKFGR